MIIEDNMIAALVDIANRAVDLAYYLDSYGFDYKDDQFYELNRELEIALSKFRNLVIEVTFKDVNNN